MAHLGAQMVAKIPDDAIAFVRSVFATANTEATMTLARQPSAHEEMLDFQVFAVLDRVGPTRMSGSGTVVAIDTHWLGGRRHWMRWEIADIAIVLVLRRNGKLLWRKIALLQSKRLYSREISVVELEQADFRIGIGRLIDRESITSLTKPRHFSFTTECVYGAMASGTDQVKAITDYSKKRNIPVYYSFYNPPTIPFKGSLPRVSTLPSSPTAIPLGCRVLRAPDAHAALDKLPKGTTPQFIQMVVAVQSDHDPFADHGWRLEAFVADEVMRCHEGRRFKSADDKDLQALLYARAGPINSMIMITMDLPSPKRD